MDKKDLIELTNKVYRLSVLFPKKEPLRYKIREVADNVLSNFISWEFFNNSDFSFLRVSDIKERQNFAFSLNKDLEIIKSYFDIAKWQNWASYFDILEIEEKYDSIYTKINARNKSIEKENIEQPAISEVMPLMPVLEASQQECNNDLLFRKKSSFASRKEKIIEILGQKQKIQVWEINVLFPDISRRTIRRDFVQLLRQGLIERMGERSETFYKLKSNQA